MNFRGDREEAPIGFFNLIAFYFSARLSNLGENSDFFASGIGATSDF